MALDKQKLILEIEAKGGNTKKVLSDTAKEITGLGDKASDSSKKTNKAVSDMEKKYEKLARQVSNMPDVQKALKIKKGVVEKSSKSIDNFNQIIVVTSGSTNEFTKSLKSNENALNSYHKQSLQLVDVIQIFVVLQDTLSNFISIINIMTSPQSLARFQSLTKALGLVARVKGFKAQSDQLLMLSDTLGNLKEEMEQVDMSFVDKQVLEIEQSINMAASAINFFDTSMKILKATLFSFASLAVVNQFVVFDKKIISATGNIKKMGLHAYKSAKAITDIHTPGLLGMGQAASSLSGAFVTLGLMAMNSDSKFVHLSGTVMTLIGILSGGLSFAIYASMIALAGLASKIGGALMQSMGEFEKKSAKAELATNTFSFTVEGFGKTLGETVVGSLSKWNDFLSELSGNTVSTMEDLRKSTKLLVADASVIGITFDQNKEILKRAADIAASQGRNIVDVTNSIISALNGQAIGLRNMGVDLSEGGLSHSKYAKKVGLNTKSLNENEVVQARYNVLLEKTIPILGAAAAETETVIGMQIKMGETIDNIQIKLGDGATFTRLYMEAVTSLGLAFLSLPDSVFATIGSLQDFFGITLKVGGEILKITLFAGTLFSGYAVLAGMVTTNIFVQGVLTKVMAVATSVIGAQSVAVTSLSTLFLNLGIILKGLLAKALVSFISLLKGVILMIKQLTVAIITNPLLYKALAIGAAIFTVIKAIQELNKEMNEHLSILNKNGKAMENNSGKVSLLAGLFKSLKEYGHGIYRFFVNLTKLLLTGVLVGTLKLTKGFIWLQKKIAEIKGDSVEKFDKGLSKANKTIEEAQMLGGSFAVAMLTGFEETAQAAENASNEIKKLKKAVQDFQSFDMDEVKIEVFGDNFQQAILANERAIKNVFDVIKKSAKDVKKGEINSLERQKLIDDAKRQAALSGGNLIKIQRDQLAEFDAIRISSHIEQLKDQKLLVEAAKEESRQKIAAFEKTVQSLVKLNLLTKDGLKGVNATRKALIAQGEAAIKAARAKEIEEAQKDAIEAYKKMSDETSKVNDELAKIGKTQIDAIRTEEKRSLAAIDNLEKELKAVDALTDARKAGLDAARTSTKAKADADVKGVTGGADEGMINSIQAFQGGITEAFAPMMGMVGAVQGAVSAMQAIVDAIPNLLNSISGLIGSITDFPLVFRDALLNLVNEIVRFVAEFIPNIIASVGDILDGLIQGLLIDLPDALIELLSNGIPNALVSLTERLPEIAQKLVFGMITNMPKMAIAFIKYLIVGVPKIIKSLIKAIPEIVKALIDGLVEAFKEIASLFTGLFNGDDFVENISEGFAKVSNVLTGASSDVFNVSDLGDAVNKDRSKNLAESIEQAGRNSVSWLVKAWHKIWNWAKEMWDGLIDGLKKAWDFVISLFNGIIKLVKAIFDGIIKLFIKLWDGVKKLFDGIIVLFQALWDGVKKIFDVIIEAFIKLWDGVKKIFDGIIEAFIKLWDGVKKIFDGIIEAFIKLWDVVSGIFDTVSKTIGEVFDKIISFFSDAGSKIWAGFQTAAKEIGNFFSGLGTNIWNGLKAGIDTLEDFFKNLFDKLNPANLFEKIFKVDSKGKGTVEKALGINIPFANFARGGVVPGVPKVAGDSMKNDTVPALLSPGEAIIPRSIMEDPLLSKVIKSVLDGDKIPGFAFGGFVGDAIGGAVSTGKDVVGGAVKVAENVWNSTLEALGVTDPWKAVKDKTFGMVMDMFRSNAFSSGGMVGVGSDTIPSMLTPGEFVISKPAVDQVGVENLRALNSGKSSFGGQTTVNNNNEFRIEIKGDNIDRRFIDNELMPVIEEKLRRMSLDGRRVLSSQGVR